MSKKPHASNMPYPPQILTIFVVQPLIHEPNWINYRSRWFFKEWQQHRNQTVNAWNHWDMKTLFASFVTTNSPHSLHPQVSIIKITNHQSTESCVQSCADLPIASLRCKIALPFFFFSLRLNYLKKKNAVNSTWSTSIAVQACDI